MNYKKIIILLLIISMGFSFTVLIQRYNIEKDYKNVEFVLDYEEIKKLSDFSSESIVSWLEFFKDKKMTKASLQEENIDSLIKSGKELKGELVYNIKRNFESFNELPEEILGKIDQGEIQDYDFLISLYNEDIYRFVKEGLVERYNSDFFKIYDNNKTKYIILNGDVKDLLLEEESKYLDYLGDPYLEKDSEFISKLKFIGIGYDINKISNIKEANLDLVLRPINYEPHSKKIAENYLEKAKEYNADKKLIIFHGKSIIGYPKGYEIIKNYIEKEEILPLLIETPVQRGHIEQDGIDRLLYDTGYNGVRGFTMWDYIRERYGEYNYEGPEEIENSIYRAITERNVRVIYFKPYMLEKNVFLTDKDIYDESFDRLYRRLEEHNIAIGQIEEIQKNEISIIYLFIMFLSVIILGLYLLKRYIRISNKANLSLGFIGIIFSGLLLLYSKSIGGKIFALTSSIVYGSFAIGYMIENMKHSINYNETKDLLKLTIRLIIVIFSLSIIGGLITTSFLSQTKYFLEADIFRGVKISQILPIIIFLIIYIQINYNKKNNLEIYSKLFNSNIKIYYGIILLVIAGIGFYYISRTGHETDIEPLEIEMIFRNFLETHLIARPRTKEFLFAAPSLAAGIYFLSRKKEILAFAFSLGAVTGITSVINTFTHLRTPLYLSLYRSVASLGFSLITGLLTIIILIAIERILKSFKEKNHV